MSILSLRGTIESRLAAFVTNYTNYQIVTGQSIEVTEVPNLVIVNCERIQIHPEMVYLDGNWQASIRVTVTTEHNTFEDPVIEHRKVVKAICAAFNNHSLVRTALAPIITYRLVIEAMDEQLENNVIGTGIILSLEFCDAQPAT